MNAEQLVEAIEGHFQRTRRFLPRAECEELAKELAPAIAELERVPFPSKRVRRYPGEPSFTIVAHDNCALPVLRLLTQVYTIGPDVLGSFMEWRLQNRTLCKDPD